MIGPPGFGVAVVGAAVVGIVVGGGVVGIGCAVVGTGAAVVGAVVGVVESVAVVDVVMFCVDVVVDAANVGGEIAVPVVVGVVAPMGSAWMVDVLTIDVVGAFRNGGLVVDGSGAMPDGSANVTSASGADVVSEVSAVDVVVGWGSWAARISSRVVVVRPAGVEVVGSAMVSASAALSSSAAAVRAARCMASRTEPASATESASRSPSDPVNTSTSIVRRASVLGRETRSPVSQLPVLS